MPNIDSINKNIESDTIIEINKNAWSFEHDELLSKWGDKAACYAWMHDATQRKFSRINMILGLPVIIFSAISGTANFGISTIFPSGFEYGNAIIGTLSLITAVISTISNFLGYVQSEEAHRISGVQWAKFRRTIELELSINPSERKNVSEFIKYSKSELDRLMDHNPTIPEDIINKFINTFKKVKNVRMPEICNKLEPTTLYSELYNSRINNSKVEELFKSETNTSDQLSKTAVAESATLSTISVKLDPSNKNDNIELINYSNSLDKPKKLINSKYPSALHSIINKK
jgi:hypothetical protein